MSLLRAVLDADRIALGIGSNSRLDKMLSIIAMLKGRAFLSNVTIFMMGRELPEYLSANTNRLHTFSAVRCIFAESRSLVAEFDCIGCTNSRYLPNFRKGDGACAPRPVGDVVHFVFFAQVRPEKGIDTLAKAAIALNAAGFRGKFDIDVYGRVIEDYKIEFDRILECVPNMRYKGVVDAATANIYSVLNQYDVAISSSSWQEGMSGSNIECKFSGIANIVSDAGFNSECIANEISGLLVKPRDVDSLACAMARVIKDRPFLAQLKLGSFDSRVDYDIATCRQEVLDVVFGDQSSN